MTEEMKVYVTWYDSMRKIVVFAPKTTGPEWVELKEFVKELMMKYDEDNIL